VALLYSLTFKRGSICSRACSRSPNDQSLTVQNNEINKILIERPELRPYFYDDTAPPAEPGPLKSQIEAVAEMYLDS